MGRHGDVVAPVAAVAGPPAGGVAVAAAAVGGRLGQELEAVGLAIVVQK